MKVFGIVEGAEISAGGSVFVSEGIAGLQKGFVVAQEDVHAGYINQGNIAGRDLFVENSILHSHCVAKNNMSCQKGNIIGGVMSCGKKITAKDIGSKMDTKTELVIGINKKIQVKEQKSLKSKQELSASLEKINVIGEKFKTKQTSVEGLSTKERIMLLRQRNTLQALKKQIADVEIELEQINSSMGGISDAVIVVNGSMYPNVHLTFGKYTRQISQTFQNIHVKVDNLEITVISL